MKVKQLNEDDARMTYYSIRERLAAIELAKELNLDITNMSDEEGKESWDIIYNKDNMTNIAEIKVRKRFSTDFDGKKWIFEKIKYDALIKLINSKEGIAFNLQPKFIIFFFDKVAIFDVNQIKEENFFIEELRASSVNGYQNKKPKQITHLDLANANIIDYQLDYDKLNINAKNIFKYRYPTTKLTLNQYED